MLHGKTALVTGGASGLGRCHALALAAAGARVMIADTASEPAAALVEEILARGGSAACISGSIDDWSSAEAAVAASISQWGDLDIVVNNAGIVCPRSLMEADAASFMAELRVHVLGTLAISHHASRHWSAIGTRAGRAIINTSSAAGLVPLAGTSGYAAAKAAIVALTGVHAAELAHLGVRVNAIAPIGRTPMVAASPRMAALMPKIDGGHFDPHAPEHTSTLVVYLASQLNRFTGRLFGVGGSQVAIYRPFDASDLVSNGDQPWSIASLASALASLQPDARVHSFEPAGLRLRSLPDPAVSDLVADTSPATLQGHAR